MILTGRFRGFRIAAAEVTQHSIRFIRYTALVAAVRDTVKLYREGRLGKLRTRERKPLKPLNPAQIRAIRKKWGASQAIFAEILNVPKKTYISWESGYKNPSGAALKLLMIAKEKPEGLLVA
jgi:putative transcriptional regulator